MDIELVRGDAVAGSSEAGGEIGAQVRYELWSSATHEIASCTTASHRYASTGTHGVANGLNDPTPDPHSAAGSDTSANADNVP
jgi:hypothetical protein